MRRSANPQSLSRRGFLQLATSAAAYQALAWPWMSAMAATSEDYRALVYVFLFGGNDSNNMIVPTDSAAYAVYSAARAPSALNIAKESLLAMTPASAGGQTFGLAPALAPLHSLWQKGQLAVQCNVGALAYPVKTVADYKAKAQALPYGLFSHSDQQTQWQAAESLKLSATGWGGRIADVVGTTSVNVPVVLSLAGTNLFSLGASSSPLALPSTGTFGLSGSSSVINNSAIAELLKIDRSSTLAKATSDTITSALSGAKVLGPILSTSNSLVDTSFANLTTSGNSIGAQLKAVARIMAARSTLGIKRQIFFVSQGGYDTHSNQNTVQGTLLNDLGNALAAFQNSLESLGIADNVVSFTGSDFGRTLRPNATNGTDHAWGNHQLIMGKPVIGGDFYGTFPTIALGSPDDVDGSKGSGRWLPTTSVDQYAAQLARWLGVSNSDLTVVLPNLSRFNSTKSFLTA